MPSVPPQDHGAGAFAHARGHGSLQGVRQPLERLVSRFATPKSEEARLDSLADPASLSGLDENDPASMTRWMKRMGKEMGEDFGDELDQAVEQEMENDGAAAPALDSDDGDL